MKTVLKRSDVFIKCEMWVRVYLTKVNFCRGHPVV
jgi:hypothetical protein